MQYELPEKLKNLTPYSPDSGDFPVRLDANESFILPGEAIRLEISEKINSVLLNRYPDTLSAEVCNAFGEYYGINPENVTAGNGSDELISVIINSFFEKDDKILTSSPDFSMYSFYIHLAQCTEISVPKIPSLKIDPDAIINTAIKSGCRGIIFSNPCNPASTVLPAEDVRKIIEKSGALVILDEAYMDFADETLINSVCEYDNLIILRTCSKMIGMAAARMGFAVANPRITKALRAAKSPYNVNSLSAAAASVVLKKREYLKSCTVNIIESKNALNTALSGFEELKIYPSQANFLYIEAPAHRDLFEFLKSRGILIRCLPGALRVTAGNADENKALADAVCEYFKLKG